MDRDKVVEAGWMDSPPMAVVGTTDGPQSSIFGISTNIVSVEFAHAQLKSIIVTFTNYLYN